jgi:hypothetical protein
MLKTPGIINAPHATEVMLSLQEQEQVGMVKKWIWNF